MAAASAAAGARIVDRARALVGSPFRPQGRSLTTGLDCIGLAALALHVPLDQVRRDYRLRGGNSGDVEFALERFCSQLAVRNAVPGDLLLARPGAAQLHLLILTEGGYIHADAGLGRVVEVPGAVPWPVLSAWRRHDSLTETK